MPDLLDQLRAIAGDRGTDADPASPEPTTTSFPPVPATGSSNVESFGWEPLDPTAKAAFARDVANYGSPAYAALARPDQTPGVLTVSFLSGGVYQYQPVPKQVFVDMLNAGSRGVFVHQVVKHYPFVRVA